MFVPATAPVQPGHPIRVNLGNVSRPEFGRLSEKPLDADIVRVSREDLLTRGEIAVGIRFASA